MNYLIVNSVLFVCVWNAYVYFFVIVFIFYSFQVLCDKSGLKILNAILTLMIRGVGEGNRDIFQPQVLERDS